MKTRILVLGAGFGGLELSTLLSEAAGDEIDVTLIDKSDHFVFGFSKLDAMFHRKTPTEIRHSYAQFVKPGVRFVRAQIESIDPAAKRVQTSSGDFEADIMVVALGADFDLAATPGLSEHGNEFYSVAGALALRDILSKFTRGHAVVGISGTPYKCPPAPSEAALMLHDYLTMRGVRDACTITLVTPLPTPIPPSPESSDALKSAFAERGITLITSDRIIALDGERRMVVLESGKDLPFDLYLGIPRHCVPDVVAKSGMAEGGWIAVDPRTLETKYDDVYAIGDVSSTGVPKAGVFAEGGATVVGKAILRRIHGGSEVAPFAGAGSCYIEYGGNMVGRVDIDFLSGPSVTAKFHEPSTELVKEKVSFGSSRTARWFGR